MASGQQATARPLAFASAALFPVAASLGGNQRVTCRQLGSRLPASTKSKAAQAAARTADRHAQQAERYRTSALLASAMAAAAVEADGEVVRLREENAALRRELASRMESLPAGQRDVVLEQHVALRAAASAVGEDIPSLAGIPPPAAVVPTPVVAARVEAAAAPTAVVAAVPASAPQQSRVIQETGMEVVMEPRGDEMVFKFGPAGAEQTAAGVTNAAKASSLAVPPSPGAAPSPGSGGAVSVGDSAVSAVTAVTQTAQVEASLSGSESDSDVTQPRRRRATGTAARPRATTTKTAAKRTPKADPQAAARAAASKEAASHKPADAIQGKELWMYLTVPATPVAGADCVLYFNRAQSEPLRSAGTVQLHAKFNDWEVEPQGATDRLTLEPVQEVARAEGTDFCRATFTVPADAYELNFIFSDGQGLYDNNATQNYVLPVSGPMTRELWVDTAPERAEAAYLARKEQERIAAEKAAAEQEAAAQQQDAEKAAALVAELKERCQEWQGSAARSGSSPFGAALWRTSPEVAAAGGKVKVLYNRAVGPLADIPVPEDQALVLKCGHNGWKSPQDVVMERAARVAGAAATDEWWEAAVSLPKDAAVLDFVVAYHSNFDNNGGADHRMVVDRPHTAASLTAWADGLLGQLRDELKAQRQAEAAAEQAKQQAREEARDAARAKVEHVRRLQMRHVLFTEPPQPKAGQEVTIHYNPDNTVLSGAERVFLRGGYNRWRHPKGYGPLEMAAPEGGASHFSARVTVPKDAYSLDFVFSDFEEGGRFDNASGLDYHMPVEGSVVGEPPLYVVHVAVEMAPVAKVGGLGDVVTALGRAVQELGHQVEVILPRYDFFLGSPILGGRMAYETEFEWAGTRVFVSTCEVEGVRVWFLEAGNGMFATNTVYQGPSDAARFEWFSRAACEFLLRTNRQPDILHCHDWSTADVAKAYWEEYHSYGLYKPSVIFTIHNLNYGAAKIGEAAYYSQRFTTVSPSYAAEIGGHPAISANAGKLMGIRNGIDPDIWNPETDQFLPRGYTADNVVEGKAAAREELRRRLGLSGWGDKPLVGVVTRLTKQKGTHLIAHSAWRTLDRGGQFVLLGSAPDPKVQAEFDALANSCQGDNAAFCFSFDEPLSHLIYAACDIILVPSMFEPCGLTQMIAMRYGAVPVVRATGGLRDTVFDVDNDKARGAWELEGSTNWQADGVDATNGFSFEGTDPGALDYALNRALDAYYNDRAWFHSLQERVARQDWSWNKPAIDYIQLYFAALKKG